MLGTLFKDMDLYKGIILASAVVLPAGGGGIYWLQQRIDTAESAIRAAERRGGELEAIGQAYKQLKTLARSTRSGGEMAKTQPRRFFEQQLVKGVSLQPTEFSVSFSPGRASPKNTKDTVAKITFPKTGKQDLTLTQEQINVAIFNIESQSRGVWKLFNLSMSNADVQRRAKEAPKATLADKWVVKSLEFVMREPDKSKKSRKSKSR